MSIEIDWETNKAECPKCKRRFKIGAFSRDGEICNSCDARSERQMLRATQILNDLPDYDAVNWRQYSDTKSRFLLLCGLKRELSSTPSIQAAAARMKVNPGLISRVISGGDSPTLRRYFGLPEKEMAAVTPCVDCGDIHTLDYCPDKDIKSNFNRPDWIAERDQLIERIEKLESEKSELLSMDADDLRLWYMKAGEKFKEPPKPKRQPAKRQPSSPDDLVSLTVKVKRHERDAINDRARSMGITTKDLVISELVESE